MSTASTVDATSTVVAISISTAIVAAIEKHDGDYYFVEPQLHTDTTYLACYTSPRKPTEWLSVMNQENETLLDSRQQLWRLAVYS